MATGPAAAATAARLEPSSRVSDELGIPSSLEVRESEQYGRGVYAATAFSPGTEVMRAEPIVHVLSNDVRGQMCDFCLNESK